MCDVFPVTTNVMRVGCHCPQRAAMKLPAKLLVFHRQATPNPPYEIQPFLIHSQGVQSV